jgi:hypothetical protein
VTILALEVVTGAAVNAHRLWDERPRTTSIGVAPAPLGPITGVDRDQARESALRSVPRGLPAGPALRRRPPPTDRSAARRSRRR